MKLSFFPAAVTMALGMLLAGCGGAEELELYGYSHQSPAYSVAVHGGDVYVLGATTWDRDGWVSPANPPVLWKNGVPETLGIGRDYYSMQASHLAVSDSGVVYVAGTVKYERLQPTLIVLWTDGSPHVFDRWPSTTYYAVLGLAVSGDDVYIAAGGNPLSAIWKNGVPTYPDTTKSHPSITSIFASGEDLYTTEIDFGRVWKNDELLMQGIRRPTSIFVSGGDVYVSWNSEAGSVGYWKNGEKHVLSEYPSYLGTTRLFVSGEDVYLLGKDKYGDEIVYWKNGQRHGPIINSFYSECKSIAVSGDDVYVVADVEGRGRLWKNGVEQALPPANPVW